MITCKFCNKEYKTYQSRSNHIKIYHNKNISQNTTQFECVPQNNTIISQNNINKCKHCSKILSRYDSVKRHEIICKNNINNNFLEENNELKTIIKQQTEIINEMKKQQLEIIKVMKEKQSESEEIIQMKSVLNELINKNCKVHPKTLQKINKQLNGDHNTINENNGTINNTFIIALGHENLPEIFSKKEKINVLKNRFNSLPFLVEYTHFNSKYPQFKNILITNTQNNLAYKYDNKKKQFLAVNKNELLEDIVDERMCDINSFYEELETDLDEKTKEILDKVKEKIDNDPEFRELKKKDIKLIIYNNRSKVSKENTSNIEL